MIWTHHSMLQSFTFGYLAGQLLAEVNSTKSFMLFFTELEFFKKNHSHRFSPFQQDHLILTSIRQKPQKLKMIFAVFFSLPFLLTQHFFSRTTMWLSCAPLRWMLRFEGCYKFQCGLKELSICRAQHWKIRTSWELSRYKNIIFLFSSPPLNLNFAILIFINRA